ncbi:MAG TPA: peptide-methionine (R)-S-oxide reductase MsrB [Flavobacterium sp.]|jgi:peptide-methionine (R)-S-oxide reductase
MRTTLIVCLTLLFLTSCQGQQQNKTSAKTVAAKVQKTDEQWRKELTPDQYAVLREKGTEAPFTGEYVDNFEEGIYVCAACGAKLFDSDSKFRSDCGWPSFDKAIKGSVAYTTDRTLGMIRTEITCANCGGHLGHVFDDGPTETTGQRFCTNSVSVKFIPQH